MQQDIEALRKQLQQLRLFIGFMCLSVFGLIIYSFRQPGDKFGIIRALFIFIAYFLISVSPKTVFAQQPAFTTDSLDNYISYALKLWQIPGAAVAIVKNDTVIYTKSFGVIDLSNQRKTDNTTLFPIWSMGKSFTSFSLALLEERKQINLNDKVKKIYPSFKMIYKNYQDEMNLIDLLSHRMGIETFQGDFLWSESTLSNEQLINKWSKFSPQYAIRSGFQYSNFGYLLAGNVIEQVTRKSWQSFLANEVLLPLGMTNSILNVVDLKQKQNIANGHVKANGLIVPLPEGKRLRIEAFGGMYTTIYDMILWIRLHLNKGKLGSARLFEESLFNRVHKPQNIVGKMYLPDGSSPNVNYALGWEVRDFQHREVITHGGAYSGFASMMGFVPQEKLGFVILTNSDAHELGEALKWQIINAYINRNYVNYAKSMHDYTQASEEWEAKNTSKMQDSIALNIGTDVPLKNFTGRYHNPIYGKVEVEMKDTGSLKLKFEHHPQLYAVLNHIGNNRFWCEYSQPMFGKVVIPFTVKNNKIKTFELSVHQYVEFTKYTFTKDE